MPAPRTFHRRGQHHLQPAVAGQAEQEIDTIRLAPTHELFTCKTAVGAQNDLDIGPDRSQLRHNSLHFLQGAGTRIDVRRSQLRAQDIVPAENVQRQVTVTVVVAVKKPAFLFPVQRIVRRVQIQHQHLGRLPLPADKLGHKQIRYCRRPQHHFLVSRQRSLPVLQAIQGALAGQWLALVFLPHPIRSRRIGLLAQDRQQRVRPQALVVIEILIPQRQPEDPLPHHRLH